MTDLFEDLKECCSIPDVYICSCADNAALKEKLAEAEKHYEAEVEACRKMQDRAWDSEKLLAESVAQENKLRVALKMSWSRLNMLIVGSGEPTAIMVARDAQREIDLALLAPPSPVKPLDTGYVRGGRWVNDGSNGAVNYCECQNCRPLAPNRSK